MVSQHTAGAGDSRMAGMRNAFERTHEEKRRAAVGNCRAELLVQAPAPAAIAVRPGRHRRRQPPIGDSNTVLLECFDNRENRWRKPLAGALAAQFHAFAIAI